MSFRHQILCSHSVQMDHLQGLSPANWQMKIGKESAVYINLRLGVTEIIVEFLSISKSSLPLTAKLFSQCCGCEENFAGCSVTENTHTSWLAQTILLWSLNHQPLHTCADTFSLASCSGTTAPLQCLYAQSCNNWGSIRCEGISQQAAGQSFSTSSDLNTWFQLCTRARSNTHAVSFPVSDICNSWLEFLSSCNYILLTVPGLSEILDKPNLHPASVFMNKYHINCIFKEKKRSFSDSVELYQLSFIESDRKCKQMFRFFCCLVLKFFLVHFFSLKWATSNQPLKKEANMV